LGSASVTKYPSLLLMSKGGGAGKVMGVREARAALKRAKSQLERVQVAWWDPPDPVEAVTWAFYAYENAIVAVAEAKSIRWEKSHAAKARLAGQFVQQGILSTDVEDRLIELNDLRKDVAYGESGPELEELDLEDLAIKLEEFLEEVEQVIDAVEEEK